MSSKLVLIAGGSLALAACNTANSHIGDEDPYMGEAVRYNAAIQTINPDPVYPVDSAKPGENGDKGAQAVKRYRTDGVNARHQAGANTANSGQSSGTGGSGPR